MSSSPTALCSVDAEPIFVSLVNRHRVFAELLEQGTRTTLKIPTHIPAASLSSTSLSNLALPSESRAALEVDSVKSLGLNPTQALQHPGFYYYMAARCTENRRIRYQQILESEVCVFRMVIFCERDRERLKGCVGYFAGCGFFSWICE